jgi:hypothetical protein
MIGRVRTESSEEPLLLLKRRNDATSFGDLSSFSSPAVIAVAVDFHALHHYCFTMTDTFPLNVKWNKDAFTVDFVLAGGVKALKNELEEKTGVPSDRMKLMAKSKGASVGGVVDTGDFDLTLACSEVC